MRNMLYLLFFLLSACTAERIDGYPKIAPAAYRVTGIEVSAGNDAVKDHHQFDSARKQLQGVLKKNDERYNSPDGRQVMLLIKIDEISMSVNMALAVAWADSPYLKGTVFLRDATTSETIGALQITGTGPVHYTDSDLIGYAIGTRPVDKYLTHSVKNFTELIAMHLYSSYHDRNLVVVKPKRAR